MAITEVAVNQRLTGYFAQCVAVFVTWSYGTSTQGTCAVAGQNDISTVTLTKNSIYDVYENWDTNTNIN